MFRCMTCNKNTFLINKGINISNSIDDYIPFCPCGNIDKNNFKALKSCSEEINDELD